MKVKENFKPTLSKGQTSKDISIPFVNQNGEEVELKDDNSLATEEYVVAYKTKSDKLEVVEDNLPQNDEIFRGIKEDISVLKVVYFNEEKELSTIAKNNSISLDNLFKTNKYTDFNNKKRVIIKYGK